MSCSLTKYRSVNSEVLDMSTFENSRYAVFLSCNARILPIAIRTLWWFRHGRAQTVHVVASVAIITEQQLVLEQRRIFT